MVTRSPLRVDHGGDGGGNGNTVSGGDFVQMFSHQWRKRDVNPDLSLGFVCVVFHRKSLIAHTEQGRNVYFVCMIIACVTFVLRVCLACVVSAHR